MTLRSLAEDAVARIGKAVSASLTEQETNAISKIIEETLVRAVNEATQSCSKAAVVCCGPEADMAHKIAEEVDRARIALVANLMSMR